MTLRGHKESIASVAFSPDGKTIGAGSYNSIKLWESTTPAGGYEPRWNAEAARKVVDQLYKKHGVNYYEVIDKLKADKTLAEPVRKLALQIANSRLRKDTEKLKKEGERTIHEVVLSGEWSTGDANAADSWGRVVITGSV